MRLNDIVMVLLMVGVTYAGIEYWRSLTETKSAQGMSVQAQMINQCDLIASKAAAGLPEALPFQRLEKAARQSRVLERCMQDRGYEENPAWVSAAKPAVAKLVSAEGISENEAFERLRRKAMLVQEEVGVTYWRRSPS